MKGLFSETEASIQGIFNYYITLVTAVIGGIALIFQFPSNAPSNGVGSQIVIFGLLILASIIGTIYLLSVVYRYSRLIGYGRNLDALRLHLIQELDAPMPSIYSRFMRETDSPTSSKLKAPLVWLAWLLPTGTHQLTMAFINSFVISIATWLLLTITGTTSTEFYNSIITIFIEFFLIFNVYNIYSRIALKHWLSDFGASLNPHFKNPFHMLR